ncbi:zinc ribbon domain-containing protein YjdM [Nocardioides daeguensis]|uniref:Zinc ribbon domain-containing protein YjdM n=1 Tax=Nocardioides daeguensis TaxID=908359 RepID=A0ABP6UU70_9ACTN|nr:zinc ribbon domain-containing protein YjdM [Nocardioides daeguensis]MBV6725790.1 alkylphosphonate utilization protein [Nocardioides daeguensis]MCR1772695.1 alkylphosphonate utilization protein [Nocardioides daeguensis]
MTDTLPACPECSSEYTYEMGDLLVCPECAHEWSPSEAAAEAAAEAEASLVKDVNGTPLADGDDVIIVKDLPVKGAPKPIKSGTKVRGIRLVQGVGDHDIDAKVDGFGPMQLKSSVVRKA